jgi:hypothetical protein
MSETFSVCRSNRHKRYERKKERSDRFAEEHKIMIVMIVRYQKMKDQISTPRVDKRIFNFPKSSIIK